MAEETLIELLERRFVTADGVINWNDQVKELIDSRVKREYQKSKRLREAMQEFVDRVDKGEVRSKYTYAKFKKLLENNQTTK